MICLSSQERLEYFLIPYVHFVNNLLIVWLQVKDPNTSLWILRDFLSAQEHSAGSTKEQKVKSCVMSPLNWLLISHWLSRAHTLLSQETGDSCDNGATAQLIRAFPQSLWRIGFSTALRQKTTQTEGWSKQRCGCPAGKKLTQCHGYWTDPGTGDTLLTQYVPEMFGSPDQRMGENDLHVLCSSSLS